MDHKTGETQQWQGIFWTTTQQKKARKATQTWHILTPNLLREKAAQIGSLLPQMEQESQWHYYVHLAEPARGINWKPYWQ